MTPQWKYQPQFFQGVQTVWAYRKLGSAYYWHVKRVVDTDANRHFLFHVHAMEHAERLGFIHS